MVLGLLGYMSLLKYSVGFCFFFPFWVFMFLFFQTVVFDGFIKIESEWKELELAWTIIPSILIMILCYLNVSSCGIGGVYNIVQSYKITGHQWYWSYDNGDVSYDSFMLSMVSSVDKPARLFFGETYNLLITSEDVLHSFSVPSLCIKMDAVPGRINSLVFIPDVYGSFIGYCSELCGAGHSYMPIVIEVVKNPGKDTCNMVLDFISSLYSSFKVIFNSCLRRCINF